LAIEVHQTPVDLSTVPAKGGAYLLWIALTRPLRIAPKSFKKKLMLPPGCYVYAGSAYGPGGLRARVGRHLRRNKAQRWHVDWITLHDTIGQVWIVPGASECTLISHVLSLPGSRIPIPGFGSSDCRRCAAHLALVEQTFEEANEAAAFWPF